MARLTEVRVPPAEPLGHRAAESAFELDVVFAVFLTFLEIDSSDIRAISTDELLRVEFGVILGLLPQAFTTFLSPKVRILTLKAHIVGVDRHGVLLGFLEVRVFWVGQALVLKLIFIFKPL